MSERQKLGFLFEQEIIKKENLNKCELYTDAFDAYNDKNIAVQIKSRKNNTSLCLGDLKRNFTKTEPFILYIVDYDIPHNYFKTYKVYIDDYNLYNQLFYFAEYDDFWNEFKEIPNDRKYDSLWRQCRKKYAKLYKDGHSITTMNPKRDHKKQKRIQCSISNNNIEKFLNLFNYEVLDYDYNIDEGICNADK